MATDSPFLLYRVECPICKTINEFETIRLGAYVEDGRDTDFCPTNVKWRFPRYQAYNPLAFFVATCGNCFYSRELTNQFREWKSDANFKTYRLKATKPKHLDQLATADSVMKSLGTAIDLGRHPNESAVLKLHLAIYDELMWDHYSSLDVGRFYLRIGWVFRDMERGENPNRLLLKGLIHELEADYEAARNRLAALESQTEALAERVLQHFNSPQLSADYKAQMLSYRDRYEDATARTAASAADIGAHLDSFGALLHEYRRALVGGSDDASGLSSFGRHASFGDFLSDSKAQWSGVVTNEREALEKSVFYYKEAFANGRDIAPGNQQIQASYLIAELSRRIGDYDEAKQYFTSTIRSGQEFIYQNRQDPSRTALAKKILELAIEQGRANLAAMRPV